jgi:copper(I)-binding protein
MRLPWPAVFGGALVAAVGAAGLIRGSMPQSVASEGPVSAGQISVTGAYVRAPVPPTQIAAAYFTVYNTTGRADRLVSVESGAGATSVLHAVGPGGVMSAMPDGVIIPAHGRLILSTGKGHVMIEHLFGRLRAGQTVNLELDFENAGPITVTAPVIAVGAPAPTGPPVPSTTPSGAHS